MRRFLIYAGLIITSVITVVIDVAFRHGTGFDLFSFSFWIFLPLGAFVLGALAGSGYVISAYLFHMRPRKIDFIILLVICTFTCFVLSYADYWTYSLPDGRMARDLTTFDRFFEFSITTAHFRVGRAAVDTGSVGNFGYVMYATQVLGFLLSSLAIQGFVIGLPTCGTCPAYLRKLRTKATQSVPSRVTEALHRLSQGSFEDLQRAISWRRDGAVFDNEKSDSQMLFKLYECPKCKQEVVIALPQLQVKDGWKDIPKLAVRRNISAGSTFFAEFK